MSVASKPLIETTVFKVILKMQPSEKKVFKDFPKIGTFAPSDGLSTMVCTRLIMYVGFYFRYEKCCRVQRHKLSRAQRHTIKNYVECIIIT